MVISQQEQEEQANCLYIEGLQFEVSNKVQLSLQNIKTDHMNKKLDQKNTKYTVTEVISSHSYYLNTLPRIYNVFYSKLLCLVATDPLLLQTSDDAQPPAYVIDDQEEYDVKEILCTTKVQRSPGY